MTSTKTGIEWTDKTWNPTTGCDKVSPGCTHLHPDRLDQPRRWRKPSRIFVNSNLFHENVPDDFIDHVFAVMALAPQHTFQVLTKRPERMLKYLKGTCQWGIAAHADEISGNPLAHARIKWPLPNVWLGVSVESQTYTHRVDALRQCPATIRFLSCEPLLGPLQLDLEGIHWVIVGGESGAGFRPIQPEWVRSLQQQTHDANAAFFFKQWGGRTGKANGNTLDGQQYLEFPA